MAERVDVVVVGAGMAGLRAAGILAAGGLDVVVLEASDGVGGRVRSRQVAGWTIDEGFQVLQPAYPEVRACIDLNQLELCPFEPGIAVVAGGRRVELADPRRRIEAIGPWLRTDLLGWGDRLALARLLVEVAAEPQPLQPARWPDVPFADELARRHVSGAAVDHLLRPFLGGVLLERQLTTSWRIVRPILRSFLEGVPAVPAAGMGAVAEQLAARLGPAEVRGATPVAAVDDRGVALAGGGSIHAGAVVVATDPATAAGLVAGIDAPAMRSTTTFWHRCAEPPIGRPVLVVDADGDLVASTVEMTAAAPSYGPGGGSLLATAVLGLHGADLDQVVRTELARLLGAPASTFSLVEVTAVEGALPAFDAPLGPRRSTRVGERLWVCGDHRASPSLQGALVSGRRAAVSVLRHVGRDPAPALAATRPSAQTTGQQRRQRRRSAPGPSWVGTRRRPAPVGSHQPRPANPAG